MTDYLPPPPDEIVLDSPAITKEQAEYEAQGGAMHEFWYAQNGIFYKGNVSSYEYTRDLYMSHSRKIEEFESSLKEALSQGYIDDEVAQTFAGIFGFSLKREYEFTVTVEFTFTAELDMDDDPEDVSNNLEFSVSPGYYSGIEIDNDNYEISDYQYTEV